MSIAVPSVHTTGATVFTPRTARAGSIPDAAVLRVTSTLHVVADAAYALPLPAGTANGQLLRIIVTEGDACVTLTGALHDAGAASTAVSLYVGDSLSASWCDVNARWTLARDGAMVTHRVATSVSRAYATTFEPYGTSVLHVDTRAGVLALTLRNGSAAAQLLHVGRSSGSRAATVHGAGLESVSVGEAAVLLTWTGTVWRTVGTAVHGDAVSRLTAASAAILMSAGFGLVTVNSSSGRVRVILPSTPASTNSAGVLHTIRFDHTAGLNGVTYEIMSGAVLQSTVATEAFTATWDGSSWTGGFKQGSSAPVAPTIPSGSGTFSVTLPAGCSVAWIDTSARDVLVSPPSSGSGTVRLLKTLTGSSATTGGALLLAGSSVSVTAAETVLAAVTVAYAAGVWGASHGVSQLASRTITASAAASVLTPLSYNILLVDAAAGSLNLTLPSMSALRLLLVARVDASSWNTVSLLHASLIHNMAAALYALEFVPSASAWQVLGEDAYAASTLTVPAEEVTLARRVEVAFVDTSSRDVVLQLPTPVDTALLTVRNVGAQSLSLAASTLFLGERPVVPAAGVAKLAYHGGTASTALSYARWMSV